MRSLLEREAAVRAPRFGMKRRSFLDGALGALAALTVSQQILRFASPAEAEDGFLPPDDDCYDTLRSQPAGAALDWAAIQRATTAQQSAVADTVLNMLRTTRTSYGGFAVSGFVHSTQTATRALRAGARDELVLLAVVHDAADVISPLNHAEIMAALVRPYVSEAGYRVQRTHMEFQLKHYGDKILQPVNLRERYQAEAWYADGAAFSDDWDHVSFDASYDTLPLDAFEPLVRTTFSRTPERTERTASDCLG
jgi:predicted HD phosphohydrolase